MTDWTSMDRTLYPSHNSRTNTKLFSQNLTLSGTGIHQLDSKLCSRFTIQAAPGNSGTIYVGGSSVSTSNYMAALNPGNSYDLTLYNTNLVYVRGTNADKLSVGGEY